MHWATYFIAKLADKNIINGYDNFDGTFSFRPDNYITREEYVKVLINTFDLLKDFDAGNEKTFKDVEEGAWYESFVQCAQANELIYGIGNDLFGVGEYITRQDMVVLTTRVLEKCCELKLPSDEEIEDRLDFFIDNDEISDYAKIAVAYCNINEIIIGYETDEGFLFRPHNFITRAEVSKVMIGVLDLMKRAGIPATPGSNPSHAIE